MPSCPDILPICHAGEAVGAVAGAAADSIAESWGQAWRDAAVWIIRNTVGWWTNVGSVDLAGSSTGTISGYTIPLTVGVAVVGLLVCAIRTMIAGKRDPLVDATRGLGAMVLATTLGVPLTVLTLAFGDVFSAWVLDAAASGRAADKLIALAGLDTIDSAGAAIILGIVMFLSGLIQAVLMIFREASVVILAAMIPLAASGQFMRSTRGWLPKVTGWLLALVFYKPAAALVYAAALTIWGDGDGLKENLTGVVLLVMSTFCVLPLMKLFSFVAESADAKARGGVATAAGIAATGATIAGAAHASGSQGAAADVAQTFGSTAATAAPSGAAMATPLAPAAAAVKVANGATKTVSNASKSPEENQ